MQLSKKEKMEIEKWCTVLSDEMKSVLTGINTPATLKIYTSPHCPFCPKVAAKCRAIAKINPVINVHVIDGSVFPDKALKDNVRSVPTLILDDGFRWTGEVKIEELITMIAKRDPVYISAETFMSIISDGGAEEVSDMMIARNEIFPAFIELLTDIKWTVRLGAMASYEYLAQKDKELCHTLNIMLCEKFKKFDEPIQGDLVYLMGESGDKSVIPFIESVICSNGSDEVKEAAQDALSNLNIS